MHTDRQMIELWGAWAWACMTPLHFTSDQQQLPMHELMIFRFQIALARVLSREAKNFNRINSSGFIGDWHFGTH